MKKAINRSSKMLRRAAEPEPEVPFIRNSNNIQDNDDSSIDKENQVVRALRFTVLAALTITTTIAGTGVYFYTRNQEKLNFLQAFEDASFKLMDTFLGVIEKSLVSIDSLSTAITSHALASNATFPFVTLPHFEWHGSILRVHSGAAVVHWMPLVTDETRTQWEDYAMKQRSQIDDAYESDARARLQQDEAFGWTNYEPSTRRRRKISSLQGDESVNCDDIISAISTSSDDITRTLQKSTAATATAQPQQNETILQDGTGYHRFIWSAGGLIPRGDQPNHTGPYLPFWQRSPINEQRQMLLNLNFAEGRPMANNTLQSLIISKKAIIGPSVIPIPAVVETVRANLKIGQYRHRTQDYLNEPLTYFLYPVFDTFEKQNQSVAGVVAVNIYWKFLFSNILPPGSQPILCVLENSYNQTFSYRIDGHLGNGDFYHEQYGHLKVSQVITTQNIIEKNSNPETRAYTTVTLLENVGVYEIRIHPLEHAFESTQPVLYMTIVIWVFIVTALIFVGYSCVVERRQRKMTRATIMNLQDAAAAERELNEFLAHEVRNPLAAAMTACSFVSCAVNEQFQAATTLKEDVEVIHTSLHFINDFLRSMLDIHRVDLKQIVLTKSPTDVRRDIFEPVLAMLYHRDATYAVQVQCVPENLYVKADQLRLKQVVLNSVRNSTKFVDRGFIRMRAEVDRRGNVSIYVEDSGIGIPISKRDNMFAKYQSSLETLNQGTGLGLSLSKKLMVAMGGDICLVDHYDSGVDGCPGACIMLVLNELPMEFESLPDADLEGASTATTEESRPLSKNGDHDDEGVPTLTQDLPTRLNVLFVDDDLVLRKLFTRAIRKIQPEWIVLEAASGESALKLCESQNFDLIFMDQYMASFFDKQLLGTETVHELRKGGVVNCKICGLSANDMEERFLQAGANYFVMKPLPCDPEMLQGQLRRILETSDWEEEP